MPDNLKEAGALTRLQSREPQLWLNPHYSTSKESLPKLSLTYSDIISASNTLKANSSLLLRLFPELEESKGIIESPLLAVDRLSKEVLGSHTHCGNVFVKADHCLPIAGSIKARGGIYEVLVIANEIARKSGALSAGQSLSGIPDCERDSIFSEYIVSVGSTGNLGLSIGVMSAALGFKSVVHMSADAKSWKKKRLREYGVEVIEHSGDYAAAVSAGRQEAKTDARNYFIDDENSSSLFLGYSVAALRLKAQFMEKGVIVDKEHPLFVYLPCGVGGAPGGITFGLKHIFGDNVHCFFAEPVDAPCMLVQLASQELKPKSSGALSIYDLGLTNKTQADGLAVGSASLLVAGLIKELVSGVYTVSDEMLSVGVYQAGFYESLKIETSAAAGISGPDWLLGTKEGQLYRDCHQLETLMHQSTHVIWTTGGHFIPDKEYQLLLKKGRAFQSNVPKI